MKTKHAPWSLYKKRVGARWFWYARFWNERERRYSAHRATGIEAAGKKERKAEAEAAAAEIAQTLCIASDSQPLIPFLKAFWQDGSPYFKEAELLQGRKLSAYYRKQSRDVIRLHIEQYEPFSKASAGNVPAGMIRDFMLWMAERGASNGRINRALQAIRVPLRYAISRDDTKIDPFTKIRAAKEAPREKGALTKAEAAALASAPVASAERRLAVLLGLLCGMRLGEVRGLRFEDIEGGAVHIRRNWQDLEGEKPPKFNSERSVPLPPQVERLIAGLGKKEGLVFSREKDDRPNCPGFFRNALIAELEAAGVGKEEITKRNISFHSLRHTFVSLVRLAGLNDFQAQALAGHKSAAMMNRYSHPKQVVELAECGEAMRGFFETAVQKHGENERFLKKNQEKA